MDAGVPATRRALLEALAGGPVTGPALADRLGVSRAAVWNHVEALRDAGVAVESAAAGYVVTDVSGYSGEAIAYGLDAPFDVEYHDAVGSTNDRARELAAAGADDVAVVADEQTASRGRLDREWVSPPGGVWLSVVCRPEVPPAHAPAYTLAMAVAVTRACRETGVDARIKWPNDVLVGDDEGTGAEPTERGGRKLCGILTEMEGEADRVSWLVVGVGLNANVDPADLPASADATSLLAERGEPVDRRVLVQRILEEFDDLRGDLRGAVSAWEEHADTVGRRVRVETPGGVVEGEAVGIVFPGALVVETEEGTVRVTAGDCEHLRPADR
ncbi:biotin--[acetyl-CoA-carboxylase] ligase [Halobaculum roseum]|uniref:Biotin--[acetyl-CoA-carboxylase] ligase n=1 Tax=Halobaculum roseum TaxID=2175149 RepID=A0ABD5MHE1_9EURY|nr:biotin--[acetyl-CoA-carboxylase] ligase [Halobaculum roseum]QZY04018.1 biotin--[acetyl-CoA-carboxylase] ligase [Halobaculum roseum]